MMHLKSNDVLNRLLAIVYRSFALYVADATPWTQPGDDRAKKVLHHIVADQKVYAQRIVDLLFERRAQIYFGEYPMTFTDTNDLSLDYLLNELLYYQKQDIAAISQCARELAADAEARNLAEEILGNAQGHLESLEELLTANTK